MNHCQCGNYRTLVRAHAPELRRALWAYRRRVARGVVKFWNAEKGRGAISSDELPPGRDAWAHFSHIMDMPGYRALEAGQAVEFSYEAAQQDSFDFRVIEVRLTLPD